MSVNTIGKDIGSNPDHGMENDLGSNPANRIENSLGKDTDNVIENDIESNPENRIKTGIASNPENRIENDLGSNPENEIENSLGKDTENGKENSFGSNPEIGANKYDQNFEKNTGSLVSLNNGFNYPPKPPEPQQKISNLSSMSIDSAGALQQIQLKPPIIFNQNSSQTEVYVIFIDPLERKYTCCLCDQVLRYPVQFEECSHHCCSSCLPELMRVAPRCPIDQSHIERDKVYVNKEFQKEIDNLGVRCSFFQKGCVWTGILRELSSHLENCAHRLILCPLNCNVEFETRFLEKHKLEDCPKRKIQCQFCEAVIVAENELDHLKICAKFPVPCPNGCKKKEILRENLAEHLESKCVKQELDCPFSEYGCEFKGKKKRVREHLNDEFVGHLSLMCEAIKENTRIVEEQSKVITQYQGEMEIFEKRIDSLEKLYGPQLIWKIDNYQEKFNDAKTGKKTNIFSSPFLTSRFGYKLALSACLYGDGKARGKFMSLFVCICKGEYDALLLWPYSHRITFTLIDQCQDPEARKNVVYTVKPNTCKENFPFLGRPTGERNASFGAQKFVELEVFGTLDYIRDNTIFIKVSVDSEDMIQI